MANTTVNLKRGQTIFENIVEYPLPKKRGIKDYIFYFVPTSKGYGLGASVFFRKYYKHHIPKKAKSLEEIIDILYSEIQSKSIDQIRELIIVSHGNMCELLFPVTKTAFENEENKAKYQIIRPGTLVNLQEAFKANDPASKDFKDKRKEVIQKFTDSSRVTIRACNFGSSRDGLFALYSFFGGRANVYAPCEYQFFLDRLGIGEKSRLQTDLDFYQHLVKQGYISRKTKQSETRRAKLIKELIEPGRSKHRFELSSYTIDNNRVVSGDKDEQDSLIKAFNQETVPDSVKEQFIQEKVPLSGKETIQIRKKNEKWILFDDELKINKYTYRIRYTIRVEYEQYSDEKNHQAALYVYPVLNHRNSLPSIPFQLFFSDDQDEEFKGQIFELASYSTIPNEEPDAEGKANYDAYVKLLDDGELQDNNGHNILTAFEQESVALTNPKIVPLPPVRNRKQWGIQDGSAYTIKESFYYIYPKGFMTALKVFEPITRQKRLDFFEFQGSDPDNPGTELMAYLDNHSLEELYDLIHFLREPYKEDHAFYIYMALEAMERKSGFLTWPVKKEVDEKRKNVPLLRAWDELSDLERADKEKYAYYFSNVWREAKASTSRDKEFTVDLFEEKKLPFPSEILGEVMEPDTPESDPEILEKDSNNPKGVPDPSPEYFDKETVFQEVKREDLSCQKFKKALEIIKQNKGKKWEEIEKIFRDTKIDDSNTLYDYFTSNYGYNSFELASQILEFFSPYASDSGTIVGTLGTFAESRLVFAGSVFFAIAGPLLMMKDILGEISKGEQVYKRVGIITGLKQGNAMIMEIIFDYNNHSVPIGTSYDLLSKAPNHIEAYKTFTGDTRVLILMSEFLDAHEEGYKIGLKEVNQALNEDLSKYMSLFKQFVMEKGLKECQFKELLNSGLIDENMVKRAILRGLHTQISKLARYDRVKTE